MVRYLYYLSVITLALVVIFSYRSGQTNDLLLIPLLCLSVVLFIFHLINKKKNRLK